MLLDISNISHFLPIFVYTLYTTNTDPILHFPKLPDLDPTLTQVYHIDVTKRKSYFSPKSVNDMHSFEIISESIQLGNMCKHSQLILKDIKNDVLQKEKFSFSNLFSLKRFVGMFGGSNNNKMVEYFYDKHLS